MGRFWETISGHARQQGRLLLGISGLDGRQKRFRIRQSDPGSSHLCDEIFIQVLLLHGIYLFYASTQAGQTAMQRKHSYWNPIKEAW